MPPFYPWRTRTCLGGDHRGAGGVGVYSRSSRASGEASVVGGSVWPDVVVGGERVEMDLEGVNRDNYKIYFTC